MWYVAFFFVFRAQPDDLPIARSFSPGALLLRSGALLEIRHPASAYRQ